MTVEVQMTLFQPSGQNAICKNLNKVHLSQNILITGLFLLPTTYLRHGMYCRKNETLYAKCQENNVIAADFLLMMDPLSYFSFQPMLHKVVVSTIMSVGWYI